MTAPDHKECIDACLSCIVSCNHCASMDLREEDVASLRRCIHLNMECAAICYAAAQLMSLGSGHAKAVCKLCAEICRQCAEECGKHHHEHCKECAVACRKCAEQCEAM